MLTTIRQITRRVNEPRASYQNEKFDDLENITGHFRAEKIEGILGEKPSEKITEISGIV